jgi:hypothetical protein
VKELNRDFQSCKITLRKLRVFGRYPSVRADTADIIDWLIAHVDARHHAVRDTGGLTDSQNQIIEKTI